MGPHYVLNVRLKIPGRDARFAVYILEDLRESRSPSDAVACEYTDVFTINIMAELPVDSRDQHELDVIPWI